MFLNRKLYELPSHEIQAYGHESLTYGSLTSKGVQKTVSTLCRWMDSSMIVGLDLGCGDGELIYHLERELPESRWEGVEISAHRVSMQSRDVMIWQGDMLEEDYRHYTVLHADNLCLDPRTAEQLEQKIAREFQGIYLTYRTPRCMEFFRASRHLETVSTETTWALHPIHYYRVNE